MAKKYGWRDLLNAEEKGLAKPSKNSSWRELLEYEQGSGLSADYYNETVKQGTDTYNRVAKQAGNLAQRYENKGYIDPKQYDAHRGATDKWLKQWQNTFDNLQSLGYDVSSLSGISEGYQQVGSAMDKMDMSRYAGAKDERDYYNKRLQDDIDRGEVNPANISTIGPRVAGKAQREKAADTYKGKPGSIFSQTLHEADLRNQAENEAAKRQRDEQLKKLQPYLPEYPNRPAGQPTTEPMQPERYNVPKPYDPASAPQVELKKEYGVPQSLDPSRRIASAGSTDFSFDRPQNWSSWMEQVQQAATPAPPKTDSLGRKVEDISITGGIIRGNTIHNLPAEAQEYYETTTSEGAKARTSRLQAQHDELMAERNRVFQDISDMDRALGHAPSPQDVEAYRNFVNTQVMRPKAAETLEGLDKQLSDLNEQITNTNNQATILALKENYKGFEDDPIATQKFNADMYKAKFGAEWDKMPQLEKVGIIAGDAAKMGMYTAAGGWYALSDIMGDVLGMPKNEWSQLNKELRDNLQSEMTLQAQKMGPATEAVQALISATVDTVPAMVMAVLSGGTTVAATAKQTLTTAGQGLWAGVRQSALEMFKSPNFIFNLLSEGGRGYEEERAKGYSPTEAAVNASLKAFPNAMIEQGGIQSAMQRPNVIKELVRTGLEEGGEEITQGTVGNAYDFIRSGKIMQPELDDIISWDNPEAVIAGKKMLEEGAMGAAVGGILGGTQAGVRKIGDAVMGGAEPGEVDWGDYWKKIDAEQDAQAAAAPAPVIPAITEQEAPVPVIPAMSKTIKETAEKIALSPEAAEQLKTDFDASKLDEATFSDAYTRAYQAGLEGIDPAYLTSSTAVAKLSPDLAKTAYDLGTKNFASEMRGQKMEAAAAAKLTKLKPGEGGVTYHASVDKAKLRPYQQNQINIWDTVAKVLGLNAVMFQSATDAEGNIIAGAEFGMENGKYEYSTGRIWIDVNAQKKNVKDSVQAIILKTAGHEVTHFIKHLSPVLYREYSRAVTQALANAGQDLDTLIDEQIARSAKGSAGEIDFGISLEEVIANQSDLMLRDSKVITDLQEKSPDLFNRIREWLVDFSKRVRDAFERFRGTESASQKAIMKDVEGVLRYTDELRAAWDAALGDAAGISPAASSEVKPDAPATVTMIKPSVAETAKEAAQTKPAIPASKELAAGTDVIPQNGSKGRMFTNDNTEIDFHYALVPAGSVIASNTTDFAENPAYPQDMQPRERTDRDTYKWQIEGIAKKLNPARLGASPEVNSGAPVVGADMLVENGNGRMIALQMAMKANGKPAQAYREWLKQNAASFGLKPEDVGADSVLVRVNDSKMDRNAFAEKGNESVGAAYSAAETAKIDARKVTPAMLRKFDPSKDYDSVANGAFAREFISAIMPESDRNAAIGADNRLSQNGVDRLRNALFQLAYGDSKMTARLSEATEGTIKNIVNAMVNVAPRIALTDENIKTGQLHGSSIAKPLVEAYTTAKSVQANEQPIEVYVNQTSMVPKESPEAFALLEMFAANKRSGRAITAAIESILDRVEQYGDPNQVQMPGLETAAPSTLSIIREGIADAKAKEDAGVRFQERDSDDAPLTAEQIEYFKDSKVRDAQGRLLKVYHGTPYGTFHSFEGKIFFFSKSEKFAREYAEEKSFNGEMDAEATVVRAYLNSKRLFDGSDETALSELKTALPDEIEYGFGGVKYTKDKIIDLLRGNDIKPAKWTPDKIKNAKFGEFIGDSWSGYNNDVFVGINADNRVVYTSNIEKPFLPLLTEEQKQELLNGNKISLKVKRANGGYMTVDEYKAKKATGDIFYDAYETKIEEIRPYTASQVDMPLTGQDNWTVYELTFKPNLVELIQKLGYDGIKTTEKGQENYAVFSPEQIKSTDNLAPTTDTRMRFQERDAAYLAAVNSGDMDTAQKMVDEAAKAAGYTIKAYHGTPYGGFTIFRDESFFTGNKEYADIYQNPSASSVRGRYDAADNPMTYEVYLNITRPFDTRNATEKRIFTNQFYRKYGNGTPLSERGLPDWTESTDLIEFIQENGLDYDGIILDEGGTGGYGEEVKLRGLSYVPLGPEQIKSADPVTYDDIGNPIPLSQRFTDSADIRYQEREPVPPMYSKMEQEIAGYKGDKLDAGSIVKYLTGRGVKADEIRWSGVQTFLQGKKSVTKAELLEFARGNALKVEDVSKGSSPESAKLSEVRTKRFNEYTEISGDTWRSMRNLIRKDPYYSGVSDAEKSSAIDAFHEDFRNMVLMNGTAYKDGFSNKRLGNIFEQLPADGVRQTELALQRYFVARDADRDAQGDDKFSQYALPGGTNYREILFTVPDLDGTFQSAHWDEENVLAHTRMQDMQTKDGKPVLFLEEVQSDWHEKGREQGYYSDDYQSVKLEFEEYNEQLAKKYNLNPNHNLAMYRTIAHMQESEVSKWIELQNKWRDAVGEEKGVPPAPFTTTWHEYVLKRALRMAAEGGYDYMAWTTGAMQADRYSLAKQVDAINAYQNGGERAGTYNIDVVDSNGFPLLGFTNSKMSRAEVINTFGKDLGARLIEGADNKQGGRFQVAGEGLKVGGEGMKNFYDIGGKSSQNIPRYLSKYGAQWGAGISTIEIQGDKTHSVPAIEINERMKESVLYEGQVLYQERDSTGAQLTAEQAEFFRDSKVRDTSGKLLPMYHATKADFTVFDKKKIGSSGAGKYLGYGFNFAASEASAEQYGGNVMSVYLNMASPLSDTEKTFTRGHVGKLLEMVDGANEDFTDDITMSVAWELSDEGYNINPRDSQTAQNAKYQAALKNAAKSIFDNAESDADIYAQISVASTSPYAVMDAFSQIGRDGALWHRDDGSIQYGVVFDSNQAKDVTNGSPTTNPDIRFQERTDDPSSAREILSTGFEAIAANDAERSLLKTYQGRVKELNAMEQAVTDYRTQIQAIESSIGFDPKAPNDRLIRLKNNAQTLTGKINRADKKLLTFEKAAPLKAVLDREVKKVQKKQAEIRRTQRKDLLAQHRSDTKAKVTAAKEKGKEKLSDYKTGQQSTHYKDRIKALSLELGEWIVKPTGKKYVPEVLRTTIGDFLLSINEESQRILKGGDSTIADRAFFDRLSSLRDTIQRLRTKQQSESGEVVNDVYESLNGYLDLPDNFIDKMTAIVDNTRKMTTDAAGNHVLNRMDLEQLKSLDEVMRTLSASVKTINKFLVNKHFEGVDKAGAGTIMDMSGMTSKLTRTGTMDRFLNWDNMEPYYAFERMGEAGRSIFEGLILGQDRMAKISKEIVDFAVKTFTPEEAREWGKQVHTFTLNGQPLQMTTTHIMALYALNNRKQARGHIYGGGIRVSDFKVGKTRYADAGHVISETGVDKIIGTLTPRQLDVAKKLQVFMAQRGSVLGNQVSLARFGVDLFGAEGDTYFPIESVRENMDETMDAPEGNPLYRLLNLSMTKGLTEGANNQILVHNIFDVFAAHMSDMAQYNSLALPILDAVKWYNFRQSYKASNGQKHVDSVKGSIRNAFGSPALGYITQLLKDINGARVTTGGEGMLMAAVRHYNRSAVAANLRVALLQPTSIVRALNVIDAKYLSAGSIKNLAKMRQNIKEMEKYSGIALWKQMGFYDVNLSRSLQSMIKRDDPLFDRVTEKTMAFPQAMDRITWAAIWEGAKLQVAAENKWLGQSTPAFFEKVQALFDKAIYATQVVDSMLTRSDYMRKTTFGPKWTSSFMSEPTKTYNILANMVHKYNDTIASGATRGKAWQQHGSMITRGVAVYAASVALVTMVEALASAWRDDDEFKTFWEKLTAASKEQLIDNLMPLNLPIINDLWQLFKNKLGPIIGPAIGVDIWGFEDTSPLTQGLSLLSDGVTGVINRLSGKESKTTDYGIAYKLLQGISAVTGHPMSSATREVVDLWNNTVGVMYPQYKVKRYDASSAGGFDALWESIEAGDTERMTQLRSILDSKGQTEKGIMSGLQTRARAAYQEGKLTQKRAMDLLSAQPGAVKDDVYWLTRKWEDQRARNDWSSENYSKYDKYMTAITTGKDLRKYMDELLTHGGSKDAIATAIKNEFKPIYLDMPVKDRTELKGRLLNAYTMLGYDRDDRAKAIDKWLK